LSEGRPAFRLETLHQRPILRFRASHSSSFSARVFPFHITPPSRTLSSSSRLWPSHCPRPQSSIFCSRDEADRCRFVPLTAASYYSPRGVKESPSWSESSLVSTACCSSSMRPQAGGAGPCRGARAQYGSSSSGDESEANAAPFESLADIEHLPEWTVLLSV
jgi:hypothetical protein